MDSLFKDGMELISSGDSKNSRIIFNKLVLTDPSYSLAYAGLAKCDEIDNELDSSIFNYKQSIELNPLNFSFHLNLGNVLVKKSMHLKVDKYLFEALVSFQKALDINDNDFQIYSSIGVCYIFLKDTDLAIINLEKSISLKPDNAINYYYISSCYTKLYDYEKAIWYGNKAIFFDPNNSDYFNNLGICYLNSHLNSKNITNAFSCFNKSIELNALNSSSFSYLSHIYFLNGNPKDAILYSKKAIEIDSNNFKAYIHLANSLSSLGKTNDAIKALLKCIKLNSSSFDAYYSLSILGFSFTDKMINFLEITFKSLKLSDENKIFISQVLWYHFDKIKNEPTAINYLNICNSIESNKLVSQNACFSNKNTLTFFNKIKNEYNHKNKIKNITDNSNIEPIFILGMPRSGTSLIEQIISSHSSVYGAGERGSLQNIAIDNNFPYSFSNFNIKKLNKIKELYLKDMLTNLPKNISFITDKLPFNFLYIGFIKQLFPNAKIIQLKRNKMDVCFSIYSKLFLSNLNWSYNWKDILSYYSLYDELMQFWHKRFPGQIFCCDYDALVNSPKLSIENLLNYSGLTHEANCFNPHLNDRAVFTASSLQVRDKIYNTSGKWSRYKDFFSE